MGDVVWRAEDERRTKRHSFDQKWGEKVGIWRELKKVMKDKGFWSIMTLISWLVLGCCALYWYNHFPL